MFFKKTIPSDIYSHLIAFCLNFLPNGKFLDMSKLKAFADGKLGVTKLHVDENFFFDGKQCGKKRKCWLPYQHFLLMELIVEMDDHLLLYDHSKC